MKRKVTKSFVPNLLTIANLFCGFTAIIYAFDGDLKKSVIFILLGAFFDALDGVFARLIGVASEFGGQLDSLSDVVTFGVAPSILAYNFYLVELKEVGIYLSAFPAMLGALRLARFNTQLKGFEDKEFFKGMPIPSNAAIICSFILFFEIYEHYLPKYTIVFLVTIPALLMISNVRFRNMPRPSPKNIKAKPLFFTLFFISFLLILFSGFKLLFPFMCLYLVFSTFFHIFSWIKKESTIETDFQEFLTRD